VRGVLQLMALVSDARTPLSGTSSSGQLVMSYRPFLLALLLFLAAPLQIALADAAFVDRYCPNSEPLVPISFCECHTYRSSIGVGCYWETGYALKTSPTALLSVDPLEGGTGEGDVERATDGHGENNRSAAIIIKPERQSRK
jgi:hypothetical protein